MNYIEVILNLGHKMLE